MLGNTGRSQDGVMLWTVSCLAVKRYQYWKIATKKETAVYIQKSTREAVMSQGPVLGMPYCWIPPKIVAMLRKNVAKKSDSVG